MPQGVRGHSSGGLARDEVAVTRGYPCLSVSAPPNRHALVVDRVLWRLECSSPPRGGAAVIHEDPYPEIAMRPAVPYGFDLKSVLLTGTRRRTFRTRLAQPLLGEAGVPQTAELPETGIGDLCGFPLVHDSPRLRPQLIPRARRGERRTRHARGEVLDAHVEVLRRGGRSGQGVRAGLGAYGVVANAGGRRRDRR
jgi:hypothetical protein